MAPQDGWDELPECATGCFLDALEDTDCEERDAACFCEDGMWDVVGEALSGCKDCSSDDLWLLAASYKAMCNDEGSTFSIPKPTPLPTLFIAHDQPTTDPSTSLTFIPIASHTPTFDSTELKSRDHGIPTPTIIGMAVGFAIAAVLIAGLTFFYLRERRRRKSLEWSTGEKRGSKFSSRLSLSGKRASTKPSTTTMGKSKSGSGSSVQVLDRGGWRPTGTTTTPSP